MDYEEHIEMKTAEELAEAEEYKGQILEDRRIIDAAEDEDAEDWRTVIDDNERGLFRVKYFCKFCGAWNTYGRPPFCMYCGHKMRVKK